MLVPYEVSVSQEHLDRLRDRIAAYREFPTIPGHGTVTPTYLREFLDHWLQSYDWRDHERRLNAFPQFLAEIDGERLHFVHEKGSARNGRAVILLHGWPNTHHEFLPIVDRLAHPERFGGSAEDGVDVVVPSLPGFGFSDMPATLLGPRAVADRLNALMTGVLGYDRYIVHGGDWGGLVGEWMAIRHPKHLEGLHLNLCFYRGPQGAFGSGQPGSDTPTAAESIWAAAEKEAYEREFQYFALQADDPLTLSYAMMDSPVGQAAWILDKFVLWSGHDESGGDPLFDRDKAITEIMIYLVTETFYSATTIYKAIGAEGPITLAEGQRIEVPVGFAAFPDRHCPPPPEEFIRKSHNVVRYTRMPRGGHFPALEEPLLLLEDLQHFIREAAGRPR